MGMNNVSINQKSRVKLQRAVFVTVTVQPKGAQLTAAEGSGFRRDGALPVSAGHSPYSLDSFWGPRRADLYGFKLLLVHSYLSSVPVLHPHRVPSPRFIFLRTYVHLRC